MPEFHQDNIETILETCRENTAAIAESLNQCIDSNYRIEIGEFLPWSSEGLSPAFDGPGLTVGFAVAGQGVYCLIPESLPLPDWYTHPGDSEDSRLQTLAMEWPMNMLPMEFEAEEFRTVAVEKLIAVIDEATPLDWSVVLELLLFREDDSAAETAEPQHEGSEEPHATILMVWPVSELKLLSPEPSTGDDAVPTSSDESNLSASASETQPSATSSVPPKQMQHLLNMPVMVMVCLAEKRMEMETLLTLTPGALITFNKSCEDLLDLYVNNHLYCRGEAIKIDEKFGLQINEVDVTEDKKESILGM